MISGLILLFSLLTSKNLDVKVSPQWYGNTLVLNQAYAFENDTISIQQWKCYIRAKALYFNEQCVYTFPTNTHLLDAANTNTLMWTVSIPADLQYNQLEFEVGVDSMLQMQGVQGEDLDPEQDMYWSWQSGYIHTKLEAESRIPKRQYTLHIGGYRAPFNTLQSFRVQVQGDAVHLICPMQAWMRCARNTPFSKIMKPGPDALELAKQWAKLWQVVHP
ncbi:MAG: MbnP family protein [Chitinophagaceae bacterium]